MKKNRINKIISRIVGEEPEFNLEHRFFNGVCIFTFVLGFISTLFNIWVELDPLLILSVATGCCVLLVLFILSKTVLKHNFRLLVWIMMIIAFLVMPLVWFSNAGSDGSIFLTYFVLLGVFAVVAKGTESYIFPIIIILNLTLVFLLEKEMPQWVIPYESAEQRYYDILYTTISSMILLTVIINFIMRKFHQEKIKADEANSIKSAFLANMSHEIRSPMNSILGFSELMSENELTPEKRQEYTEIIRQNGKHLMHIINDIIDISKIEAGQIEIKNSFISLNTVVDELENFVKINDKFRAKTNLKVKAIKGLDDLRSIIKTDHTRLSQILRNLLDNSLKFTQQGEISFGYKLITEQKEIEFFVKDTGTGIPENKKKMIFERFRQADDSISKKYQGAGIGLSISKGLVELMGGTIRFESTENTGTAFFFTIPYQTMMK
jgi:signal transduction histidine kinase